MRGSVLAPIDAILDRTGDALEAPYEQLLGRMRRSRALNVDETGWRLKGAQRTLWGAFTEKVAVFKITANRHEQHYANCSPTITGS